MSLRGQGPEPMQPVPAFITLLLMALVTGVSFSHLVQRGREAQLSGPQFLAVQQILLRNYGTVVGGLEASALVCALVLVVVVHARPLLFYLAGGPAVCLALMIGIWAGWINPINKNVNSWTPESLPPDWAEFRDRWHALHTLRLILSLVGLSALIALTLRLATTLI
jgi:hypothetical protein